MSKNEKKQLFDDSGTDDEDDNQLKINKSYAQRYDEWREAEIKRKCKFCIRTVLLLYTVLHFHVSII